MQQYKLADMIKGWFVGHFAPTVYQTKDVEVAVKHYQAGDKEARHVHKIATEITVVVSGEVALNGQRFSAGDIISLPPNEAADFVCLTAATTVVVKVPSVPNDKYFC